MLSSDVTTIQQLEEQLLKSPDDFIFSEGPDKLEKFNFTGPFLCKKIIWNAQLKTLKSIARIEQNQKQQQFIHISEKDNNYQLTIGLYLDKIDLAAIKCSIMMIRQYKNLRIGLHKFGPIYFIK